MKKYYAERNGHIKTSLSLSLDELKSYFIKTYQYFSNKDYFDCATKGVWKSIPFSNDEEQIMPPSLAPDPEVFFATRLQDTEVWPIYQHAEYYTEEILFSVIEILYDHIAVYDFKAKKLMQEELRGSLQSISIIF